MTRPPSITGEDHAELAQASGDFSGWLQLGRNGARKGKTLAWASDQTKKRHSSTGAVRHLLRWCQFHLGRLREALSFILKEGLLSRDIERIVAFIDAT